MYENHRKSFYRDDHRDFDDDRFDEDRWRERRAGRDPYRSGRFEPGYGNERFRSDYPGSFGGEPYGAYGPEGDFGQGGYGSRGDYGGRSGYGREPRAGFAHDPQHHQYGQGASSFGYGAGQPYGSGEGDSRYFTGQQGSWAQRSPYGARGRGTFGADYREHGYGARDYDEDERGFWDRASDEVASWFGDEDAARRREIDHRGRGPKDYVRSDERIREDANDRLTDDPRVDASNVTLTVASGEVTLNGTVGSRAEKRRAEDVVERISGVRHVQNNLRVAEAAATGTGEGGWTAGPHSAGPYAEGAATAAAAKQNAKG